MHTLMLITCLLLITVIGPFAIGASAGLVVAVSRYHDKYICVFCIVSVISSIINISLVAYDYNLAVMLVPVDMVLATIVIIGGAALLCCCRATEV